MAHIKKKIKYFFCNIYLYKNNDEKFKDFR